MANAIIKTGVFTSNILDISSEVLADGPDPYNMLFSSYNKGQNWIFCGSIHDEDIKQVLINNNEASIIDIGYEFRLFYFFGTDPIGSSLPEYEVIY